MWMILKTFELSKNPLVHLFYLILIINNVSVQRVAEPPIDIKTDNAAENLIPSNVEKGSAVNGETGKTNQALKGIIERLSFIKNSPPTRDNEEINNLEIKEDGISTADNKIEDQDVEEDHLKDIKLGLSSDLETPEDVPGDETKPTKRKKKKKKKKKKKQTSEIADEQDLETPEDVPGDETKPTKKKKKKKRKKKKKQTSEIADEQVVNDNDLETGAESNTIVGTSDTVKSTIAQISDPEENPTEDIQGMPQNQNSDIAENPDNDGKTILSEVFKNMNTGYNTPKTSENEKNNNEPDAKKIGVDEDSIKEMEPELNSDLKTPENVEPEEKTNLKKKQTSEIVDEEVVNDNDLETATELNIVGKNKNKESTITQIFDSEKKYPIENNQNDTLQKLEETDLEISPLEKVEIIKIKGNSSLESEVARKKKKRAEFKEFAPQGGEARIYCTFLGNVLKMYKKVKKRFVGHFCHAIVIGTPIILKQQRVHLTQKMKDQLSAMKLHQKESLLIVIMEYVNYDTWKQALLCNKDMDRLILEIIRTVVHYNIDGIQFSNLHPTKEGDEINTEMMDQLIIFFKDLQAAAKKKKHELKIGINIDFNGLSIVKSFTSFNSLKTLVTWYSFKSISMVPCLSQYKDTGTSPNMDFESTIKTLIKNINDNNEFDMSKLVVGIQLFPSKINEIHPYTYEEYCSVEKNTWHKSWCAASPKDLRLKGIFLRSSQVGGFQLYYMHSDDYRSTCGCYSFPLIRSFLRGLIKSPTKETCDFKTAHN